MVAVETLRQLMTTVPSGFVAARNRVAKELKAAGDREGAAAVAALRRPGLADWALNVAAGTDPAAADALVAAGTAVIDAQQAAMSGRAGPDLRDRLRSLRECVTAVVAVARVACAERGLEGAGTSTAELTSRLAAVAGNPVALALFQRAVLGAEDPGVVDPFGGDGHGGPSPRRPSATGKPAAAPAPAPAGRSRRDRDATVDLAAQRERRQAAAAAERAGQAAAAELAAVERSLAKLEGAAAKARRRVADAEARLAEAVDAADRAVAELEDGHRRREVAVVAVAAARALASP